MIRVCSWDTLIQKGKVRIQVGPRFYVVIPFESRAYAIADKCPHQSFPLINGTVEGATLCCKEHGLTIDFVNGSIPRNKKNLFLMPQENTPTIKTAKTLIQDGWVFLDI